jgi:L-alanine-DL-glutamate epimerase-like enolase superfamily enzyme
MILPSFAAFRLVPCGFILEYALGASPLLQELRLAGFPVKNGRVAIPERPGLGIEVSPALIGRYAVPA